jgi:hypothetical protein
MSIVRRGTRRTNNASPKHRAAIPKIDIQRVVGSMNTHLRDITGPFNDYVR